MKTYDTLRNGDRIVRLTESEAQQLEKPWRWSPFTATCEGCGAFFRLSWDALASMVESEVDGNDPGAGSLHDREQAVRAVTLGQAADGVQFCLHCVMGEDAPTEEYVGGDDGMGGRPVAAFVSESVPFFAYHPGGCFLGIAAQDEGRRALLSIPMLADGSPERDANNPEDPFSAATSDVTDASALNLEAVNRYLGSDFRADEFAGR